MGREVADFRRRRNSEEEPVETVALKNAWSYAREPPGEGEGNTETTGGAQRRRGGGGKEGQREGAGGPVRGMGDPGRACPQLGWRRADRTPRPGGQTVSSDESHAQLCGPLAGARVQQEDTDGGDSACGECCPGGLRGWCSNGGGAWGPRPQEGVRLGEGQQGALAGRAGAKSDVPSLGLTWCPAHSRCSVQGGL